MVQLAPGPTGEARIAWADCGSGVYGFQEYRSFELSQRPGFRAGAHPDRLGPPATHLDLSDLRIAVRTGAPLLELLARSGEQAGRRVASGDDQHHPRWHSHEHSRRRVSDRKSPPGESNVEPSFQNRRDRREWNGPQRPARRTTGLRRAPALDAAHDAVALRQSAQPVGDDFRLFGPEIGSVQGTDEGAV